MIRTVKSMLTLRLSFHHLSFVNSYPMILSKWTMLQKKLKKTGKTIKKTQIRRDK